MTDESCIYCNEGECTKGLPGTPCEIVGCMAHTKDCYLCWNNMTDKQKNDFLFNLTHMWCPKNNI